jgi:hypothetical protein
MLGFELLAEALKRVIAFQLESKLKKQVCWLLGGNKNGQSKDTNRAEKIYKEWVYDEI